MEICLYGDGGFYNRPDLPIGRQGDFVTGSSFSPLFGRATARLLGRVSGALEGPGQYLEAGYGSAVHLDALIAGLGSTDDVRLRAWDRVDRPVPEGVERLGSLDEIGRAEIEGLIFSYELFDALAVHRLVGGEDGDLQELWVESGDGGALGWRQAELSDPELAGLLDGVALEAGQIADLSLEWEPLYRRLAEKLGRGLLVTCDYGFERSRLVDPRVRRNGTLACYSGQRVHRNPLVRLGEQDLSAHVDFTRLREAGEASGLETVALSRQARWLLAAGVFDDLREADLRTREEAMGLLDGEGMGDDIRVLVQARGIDPKTILKLDLLGV